MKQEKPRAKPQRRTRKDAKKSITTKTPRHEGTEKKTASRNFGTSEKRRSANEFTEAGERKERKEKLKK